jgi:hypothetical protein
MISNHCLSSKVIIINRCLSSSSGIVMINNRY